MHLSLCHRTGDVITEIPSDSDCANDIETDTRHIHVRESGTFHNMECTHVRHFFTLKGFLNQNESMIRSVLGVMMS